MPIPTKILVAIFLLSGVVHLWNPEVFLPLMPPLLPEPVLLIYLSGIAEIVVAIGLWLKLRFFPQLAAALLIAIWPGNWWFAIDASLQGETLVAILAWLRLPLQLPLIYWALKSPVRPSSRD